MGEYALSLGGFGAPDCEGQRDTSHPAALTGCVARCRQLRGAGGAEHGQLHDGRLPRPRPLSRRALQQRHHQDHLSGPRATSHITPRHARGSSLGWPAVPPVIVNQTPGRRRAVRPPVSLHHRCMCCRLAEKKRLTNSPFDRQVAVRKGPSARASSPW